jgi:NAD(P)-dependent dehydrogenase (short-subunit alcohol dehydrogenase family)
VQCDVRSWADQAAAFKKARENSPNKSIDIVVANAGVAGMDPVFALEDDDEPQEPDLRILNINLIGVVYTAKLAMHYFNKQPGSPEDKCLIIKSSLAGYLDLIGSPSYQMSKFGVRALMCNLRRVDRCRVNLIAPWFVATPIMSQTVKETISERLKDLGSDWAHAEDSAKAVIRVASDKTVNGRALAIVPHQMRKEGFMDLAWDDYPEGSDLNTWQELCLAFTHRTLPRAQQ